MAQEIKKNDQPDRLARTTVDPFAPMRSEIDRIFDTFLGRRFGDAPSLFQGRVLDVTPSIDVSENEATIRIDAELPGMKEEDVEVSLRDGMLTIQGEKKSERDETKDNVHLTERSFGRFQRSFRVPETIDMDSIEAKMENGVLHITLPKRPEAVQPEKKIPIGKR